MEGGLDAKEEGWILVGGRSRLGRLVAESLAKESPALCGRLVLTSSRPWEGEERWLDGLSKHVQANTFVWDADDPNLTATMMADLEGLREAGTRLHQAVMMASTFEEQPFGTWDISSLEILWRRNLSLPFFVAQALGPRLETGGCLHFVLDTALHRPFLKRMPYSATRAALGAMVPALARQLAPRVRVVGHALGTVLPAEGSDEAALVERSLLKRLGSPEDLFRALRFAADSPYLTGEILTLDGGTRWA